MCIHHRLIYRKCGHFTWLGITKKCQSERNFDQGKIDEGCNVMWTHPLSTYRVDRCCESCAVERATTDRAIDEIRGRIQLTRKLLAKIQDLREASSGVLERGWSDGGAESAASMNRGSIVKVGVVDDCGGDGDVEEAETMDLIDPNEVIKVSQAHFRNMMEFVREYASSSERSPK